MPIFKVFFKITIKYNNLQKINNFICFFMIMYIYMVEFKGEGYWSV